MANEHARALRRQLTDAERKLWSILRKRQLDGLRFRRQVPIGPYIADFVCLEQRLIIEVDGGQHAVATEEDAVRTDWLRAQDFRVIRFWNNDVLGNPDGIHEAICDVIRTPEQE
jgi:very-short-patch-repair endonuclease